MFYTNLILKKKEDDDLLPDLDTVQFCNHIYLIFYHILQLYFYKFKVYLEIKNKCTILYFNFKFKITKIFSAFAKMNNPTQHILYHM